jgi:predicted nucleic acid-binding protein
MKLVINASPIIFLAKLELIGYVPSMFEEFVIPTGVKDEILQYNDEAHKWISDKGNSYIRDVGNIPSYINSWDLGKGETEVIAISKANDGFIAALDDKAARNCAYSLNIEVIGTIGLILLLMKRGIIEDTETYLNKLRNIGYRINDNLFRHAIKLSKEL